MKTHLKNSIGALVAQDYKTAAVFSKYGIDFCCKGNRILGEVCEQKNIEVDALLEELDRALESDQAPSIDYSLWPIDLLSDYLEKKHHRYIRETTPVLLQFLDKLCRVHGSKHPELLEVHALFKASAAELSQHLMKEELMLFPFVRKMVSAQLEKKSVESPKFGRVENPVARMMEEHDNEGERFRKIAQLTNNYTPPEDACTTFKTTYALLSDFEKDLHLHIHLENNILFPKAIDLEKKIQATDCH